ncbi:SusC/RagA family TonB-linked outer membrane protein [Pedobacter sp. NJ-S-72]
MGVLPMGDASITQTSAKTKLFEYTLNYNKVFGERHSFGALAGYSYNNTVWQGFSAGNKSFFSDVQKYYNLGAGQAAQPTVGSSQKEKTWASYFARINYTLDSKYSVQASIRQDGASNFADNKKWGYFPSVSASWLISEEDFIKPIHQITSIKLRAGYGETGNSNFDGSAFQQYGTALTGYFGQGVPVTGVNISQAANPNLTWETVGEFNIGLDLGLFNNRITGSVDYFNKSIRNIISFVSYPSDFIIGGVYANSGTTKSVGYEFGLQTKNIVSADRGFTWSTNLNFSHYLNYWKKRADIALKTLPKYLPVSGKDALFNAIEGYQAGGLFTGKYGTAPAWMPGMLPGGIILNDTNGFDTSGNLTGKPDGLISAADLSIIGNLDPKFSFGIGNTFTYRNFDLSIFMSGAKQMKYSPYASANADLEKSLFSFGWNTMPVVAERWSVNNPDGNFPTALSDSYKHQENTYWLVDATYLRCRNITLGYKMPQSLIARQKIVSSIRLSFDVQNAFTITKYPGLDPELDAKNLYPLVKSYVFGLSASF